MCSDCNGYGLKKHGISRFHCVLICAFLCVRVN